MLDRLRNLPGDRDEKLDLRVRELARSACPNVQCTRQLLAREDRHRKDRLVLVLGQVGEALEPRVEMRLGRDHDRRALRRGAAGDPFAWAHFRPARHLLDPGAVRGAQHEFVRPRVVEIDEAGVCLERLGDLPCDETEHLLEVERRVDSGDRLGQQTKVSGGSVHRTDCRGVSLPLP